MKTIVISSGDLTMGGLQKILVEYLKLIEVLCQLGGSKNNSKHYEIRN